MNKLKWEEAKKEIKTGTVFLEFFTEWCGDCKMMDPVVDNAEFELKKKNKNIKFIKVDAEEAALFKEKDLDWEVLKVPSFYKVENGVKTHIGYEYLPVEKLMEKF